MNTDSPSLNIGWSEVDITPENLPISLVGQFYARVSEGILSPLKASVCVLENGEEQAIFVCMDIVSIAEEIAEAVRTLLPHHVPAVTPEKVVLHATHTHTGADCRLSDKLKGYASSSDSGVNLPIATTAREYIAWVSEKLVEAIAHAWNTRKPGGVAFGLDYAVVGRNRRWVDHQDRSCMYNLRDDNKEIFRHIEGYEDHSLNLLATYDEQNQLTGLIVNVPSPSQEVESLFQISSDFWHETRAELRKRFGKNLFILPQVSAAGDLTPHLIYEHAAHQRMLDLRKHSALQEIANRISDAVGRILPAIGNTISHNPPFQHQVDTLSLPLNTLTEKDAREAEEAAAKYQEVYQAELHKLTADPQLKEEPHWYVPITQAFRRIDWHRGVAMRYEQQKKQPDMDTEVHVIRLGDIAFASNRFELYLDFGVQIKVRSPAIQTFLIQLAGEGTYMPSPRSVQGGGYGSVPASNPFGPDAGQILVDHTVQTLRRLFP